jgi:ABC-type glycerol-3-phosphate transport system permease component
VNRAGRSLNSLAVTIGATVLAVVASAMAGFAKFPLSDRGDVGPRHH